MGRRDHILRLGLSRDATRVQKREHRRLEKRREARNVVTATRPPFAPTTQQAVTWVHSKTTIGGPEHGEEGQGMERESLKRLSTP